MKSYTGIHLIPEIFSLVRFCSNMSTGVILYWPKEYSSPLNLCLCTSLLSSILLYWFFSRNLIWKGVLEVFLGRDGCGTRVWKLEVLTFWYVKTTKSTSETPWNNVLGSFDYVTRSLGSLPGWRVLIFTLGERNERTRGTLPYVWRKRCLPPSSGSLGNVKIP